MHEIMKVASTAQAAFASLDVFVAELHPHLAGVHSAQLVLLALACWLGGHMVTRGELRR